jgi:cbb3-type cytochrome oxidase subunit 3
MKQTVLQAWDLQWLSVTALVLFVICFSVYTWWTFRRENRSAYEEASRIPLNDKDDV